MSEFIINENDLIDGYSAQQIFSSTEGMVFYSSFCYSFVIIIIIVGYYF